MTKDWVHGIGHSPVCQIVLQILKKKQVTAGEVDKLGKELGNCTHQWMTNDEKNNQVLSTLSVFFWLKKKDRQQQKEERVSFFFLL